MDDTPKAWERQPTDTDKSFAAFCIYRDMGAKRSLDKAFEQYAIAHNVSKTSANRAPAYFFKWSADNSWQERVTAFDKYQDSLRQERNLDRQKLIEDNAYDDYTVIREAISKYKRDYQAVQFKGIAPHDVSNLVDLMKQADDYARRAVGLPDKITESKNEHKHSVDPIIIKTGQSMGDI